jgi:hypothetical protein
MSRAGYRSFCLLGRSVAAFIFSATGEMQISNPAAPSISFNSFSVATSVSRCPPGVKDVSSGTIRRQEPRNEVDIGPQEITNWQWPF